MYTRQNFSFKINRPANQPQRWEPFPQATESHFEYIIIQVLIRHNEVPGGRNTTFSADQLLQWNRNEMNTNATHNSVCTRSSKTLESHDQAEEQSGREEVGSCAAWCGEQVWALEADCGADRLIDSGVGEGWRCIHGKTEKPVSIHKGNHRVAWRHALGQFFNYRWLTDSSGWMWLHGALSRQKSCGSSWAGCKEKKKIQCAKK